MSADVPVIEDTAGVPFFRVTVIGNIDDHPLISVDDPCPGGMKMFTFEVTVFLMDMTVKHESRSVLIQEIVEAVEAAVGKIVKTAVSFGRSVCKQDVESVCE